MPLSPFHPLIAEWFLTQVGQPMDVQQQAWPAIQSGADALLAASVSHLQLTSDGWICSPDYAALFSSSV